MRVIAVPVKALDRGKTRLARLLTPSERARLSMAMVQSVLEAGQAQHGWQVWVISRDRTVLDAAEAAGASGIVEQQHRLGSAIRQVESMLGMSRPPDRSDTSPADLTSDLDSDTELAVLLADLPLISPASLETALALGERASVVAAPAASDGGTNLLLRRPPLAIPALFGRSSFARHRAEAYRRGVTFEEAHVEELAFDVDRPEDLTALLDREGSNPTRAACVEMGLAERLSILA